VEGLPGNKLNKWGGKNYGVRKCITESGCRKKRSPYNITVLRRILHVFYGGGAFWMGMHRSQANLEKPKKRGKENGGRGPRNVFKKRGMERVRRSKL